MGMEAGLAEAVLADWKTAPISERLRGAFRLIEVLTKHPQELSTALVSELESVGLSHVELEEIATVAFQFNFINRIADALDFTMPTGEQAARQAKVLTLAARVATGGKSPTPAWVVGADQQCRPAELDASRDQILGTSGALSAQLRRAVEATAADLWGANRPTSDLPEALNKYVRTLALNAYQIHDGLIDELKSAEYSEGEILEITWIGAFGAALASQERLFGVLQGHGQEQ